MAFEAENDLRAYLTETILPVHLRGQGAQVQGPILTGFSTPGLSVAVLPATRTKEEYSKAEILSCAFGVRDISDASSAVDGETIFQGASISKPFTAMAVLRLVVQGKLDLDVDVGEYLALAKESGVRREDLHRSAVVNPETAPRTPITLRLLLAHRSGLSTVSGLAGYYGDFHDIPPTVATLNGAAPANNHPIRAFTFPGLGTSYSGGGTTLVQHILTLVTGKPFPVLMRELVLDPLGMSRSTYEQPIHGGQAARVNYAQAHHTSFMGYAVPNLIYPEMAAAGLWTTPSDILKGLRAVYDCLDGGNNVAEEPFLPAALVADAFTENNGFGGFGIGWQLKTTDVKRRRVLIGHGGQNQGFLSGVVLAVDLPPVGSTASDEEYKPPVGIAWMSNSDHGTQLGYRIVSALGWLVNEPLNLSSGPSDLFFPALSVTAAHQAKVARQIEGWRDWLGTWKMTDGGDESVFGSKATVDIEESLGGSPVMSLSVVPDPQAQFVLLPAAVYHADESDEIVWVVRDMNVSVAMKNVKDKRTIEIWQNSARYAAERV